MKQINNETIFLLLKCTKDGEPTKPGRIKNKQRATNMGSGK